jgi:RNA polymerase sigma factor (sigma-70 family)
MTIIGKDIIESCKRNERAAQKLVYENFFDRMYAVCLRYVRNEEDTLEVLNDGFMNLFQNIQHYKGEGNFEGWVRKIIINKALDHIKMNKKHKETMQYVEEYDEEPANIETEIIDAHNAEELNNLISELPNVCRIVFNLFAIEGFSHKEIADKMNFNEGTSRWYLSESRKMLKEKLTLTLQKV